MKLQIKDKKTRFFVVWTLWSTALIPLGAFLGFLLTIAIFGYEGSDEDPLFYSTLAYCVWMPVMAILISSVQWFLLLRVQIRVSLLWIGACIGGVVIGEFIVGIVLLAMGIDRSDLGWPQGGSVLEEVPIFLLSGALIGLFQFPLVRKNFHKAGYWILACCIGWGLIPVVIYFFGGLLFGAITGVTLMWILQPKTKINKS